MIALSEFQRYLQSILDTSREDAKREVSDRYIPTLAELPLQVQTAVSSQPNSQEQQNERREQFAVLEGLRKYAPDRVLLVGKPGSGKSTSLRRLLWEESRHCLEAIEQGKREIPPIPILIELRGLKGSVLAAIQEKLGWWLDLDEKNLKAFLRDRGLFLLLDGLNELPNKQAWEAVNQFREVCTDLKVPLIITTRELGSGLVQGNVKKLEMLPLTEPQMREFVQKQLPETGGELWRQIQGKLRELAETPLLLKMLCDVFKQNNKNIPKSRGDLFRKEFARRYEEFKPERYRNISEDSRRFAFDLLSYLAFTMVQGEPHTDPFQPSASWITIPKTQAEKILVTFLAGERTPDVADMAKAKEWLEDLVEWHLLQVASDPNRIEFHHQLFQEYYAAEWLMPQLAELNDEELKYYYLNYLKWTEPLVMAMMFLESETLVVRMVMLALEVDLYLGAWVAGEVQLEFQKQTVDLVKITAEQKEVSLVNRVDLIGLTRSEPAIHYLLKDLRHQDKWVRWQTWLWLVRLLGKAASPYLIQILEEQFLALKRSGAFLKKRQGLVSIDDEAGLAQLGIWRSAVEDLADILWYLGDIGNDEVVPHLIKALKLRESDLNALRGNAATALGKIGCDAAVPYLVKELEYKDSWDPLDIIRKTMILALKDIGSKKAVAALCKIAKDASKYNFHPWTAEVLENIDQQDEVLEQQELFVPTHLWYLSDIEDHKFYNYDIARLPPPRKTQSEESSIEDLVHNKLDILTQEFKKVSEEPKRVINTQNYFEQGTHTHTHNYANDETLKQQTTELRQLVHQLQQTHQPTTEVEAAEIIDVEFREIQKTNPTQWEKIRKQLQILKRQLLNPKSHFKATKATLAEIAKHYLEESVVSKALITYVDTMSADSD
jgi:hypothetical protein